MCTHSVYSILFFHISSDDEKFELATMNPAFAIGPVLTDKLSTSVLVSQIHKCMSTDVEYMCTDIKDIAPKCPRKGHFFLVICAAYF